MLKKDVQTMQDLLIKNKEENSNSIAIICDENEISYGDFVKSVENLGKKLIDMKLKSGSRIIIMISDRAKYLSTIYGIMASGFIAVPVSTRLTKKELAFIVKDCQAETLVLDEKNFNDYAWSNDSQFSKNTILVLTESKLENKDKVHFFDFINSNLQNSNIENQKKSDDPALILYTSGTTGKKKGVVISHKNLIETSKYMNDFMEIKQNIREFIAVPLTHAFGFGRTRAILLEGGTIIIQNGKFDPKKVLNAIKKFRCNALSSVSAVFSLFIEDHQNDCKDFGKNISWIEIGSMPLHVEKKKELLDIFPNARIHMNYGMTEAMRCTLIEFRNELNKISTVGKPSPGIQIKITDYENKSLPPENIGEISVKGVNVAKGYWSDSKEWEKKFQNGWLKTDDIGYIDGDGYLTLLGRKDERINVGGQKFYPNEVESILGNILKNFRYCVCGIPDPSLILGEIPILCTEKNKNSNSKPPSIIEIQKFLKDKVEQFKIPKMLFSLDVFPLTDNGKIRRHEIRLKIMNQEKTNE